MTLEVHGSKMTNFGAHGEYEPGVDPPLQPCPFCGSTDLLCDNTHTPSYSVQCDACGAQGPDGRPAGFKFGKIRSKREADRLHREAFANAIDAWNARLETT